MDTITRRPPIGVVVARPADCPADDDLRIASLRMRHLLRLNIEALPMMHTATGTS
jgi:hypothetical protein